jgi:hypothetical protein
MGLSTKLFSLAIKRMQELGVKVSMLGAAPEKIGFYNKLGWESIPRRFNVSSIKSKDDFNFSIRPINFNTDISQISAIHKVYSKKLNGTVVRDNESYWSNWVKTEAKSFYVAEDNNVIIAYIDFVKYDQTIRIREFGELLNNGSMFSSTVSKIAVINSLNECEIVCGSNINGDFKTDRIIEENNEMIRLITPFRLDNLLIENTKQLVNVFGNLTYWDIDGF